MHSIRFRHLCFVFLLPLLGSCGGGGSSASSSSTTTPTPSATVINGITLPVEPDATANAATLKGVDANNNGVRDDVEISIVSSSTSNQQAANSLKLALTYSNFLNAPITTRESALNFISAIHCAAGKIPDNNINVLELTLNTQTRKLAYQKAENILAGYSSDELLPCP